MSTYIPIVIILAVYLIYLFYVNKIKAKDFSHTSPLSEVFSYEFKVAGVSFYNDDGTSRQEILKRLQPGMSLSIIVDSQNSYDVNALKVMSPLGCIGFVPKDEKAKLLPKLKQISRILLKSKKQVSNGLWGGIVGIEFNNDNKHIDSLSNQKSAIFKNQMEQGSLFRENEKVKVNLQLLIEISTEFEKIFSDNDNIILHHHFFNDGKIVSVEQCPGTQDSIRISVKFKHDTLSFYLKDLRKQFAKIMTIKASAFPKYIEVKKAFAPSLTPMDDLTYPKKTIVPQLIEKSRTEKKRRVKNNSSSYSDYIQDA